MMEKELYKTYYFDPADYDERGRRKSDGKSFRDVIKEFEFDFHDTYSTEYALNLYANSRTMALLAKSNDAAPFLTYGMDLTQGKSFDAVQDPFVNHNNEVRLAVPTMDDGDETEDVTINVPQFEYA